MKLLKAKDYFKAREFPLEIRRDVHNGRTETHMHDFFEFVFVEKGLSLHTCAGRFTVLLPGDMFGVRPLEPHEYTGAKEAVIYNILFDTKVFGGDYEALKRLPGLAETFQEESLEWRNVHLPLNQRMAAGKIIRAMIRQQTDQDVGWMLAVKSNLTELLVLFAQAYKKMSYLPTDRPEGQVSYVYKALSFIENNYKEPLNVGGVAESIGISADYLTKCFKKFTGLTPIDYLKHYKLAKSVEYLKNQDISIAQAAANAGFEDHTYFSRLFRQVFGMPPSDFRQTTLPEL